MTSEKKRPENLIFESRLNNIRVSIWEKVDKQGGVFHNVTIVRRYRSAPDEWSNSNSFTGLGDLALLRGAVDLAETVLREQAIKDGAQLDEVA